MHGTKGLAAWRARVKKTCLRLPRWNSAVLDSANLCTHAIGSAAPLHSSDREFYSRVPEARHRSVPAMRRDPPRAVCSTTSPGTARRSRPARVPQSVPHHLQNVVNMAKMVTRSGSALLPAHSQVPDARRSSKKGPENPHNPEVVGSNPTPAITGPVAKAAGPSVFRERRRETSAAFSRFDPRSEGFAGPVARGAGLCPATWP